MHLESTCGDLCFVLNASSIIIVQALPLINRTEYINDPNTPPFFEVAAWRLLLDLSFFIIVSTIGLNIVFGIIVDTFSELREERVSSE